MASLLDLSDELLLHTFSYLKSEKKTLRRLARICRRLLPPVRELLYHEISIYTEVHLTHGQMNWINLTLLLRSLHKNAELIPLVRHLQVYWHGDHRTVDDGVRELLSQLTNLQSLNLVTTGVAKHRPLYLLENPLRSLKKLAFTGYMEDNDIAWFMQRESLEFVRLLIDQHSKIHKAGAAVPSTLQGTSPVTDVTISSKSLLECRLIYLLGVTSNLRKLRCSFPAFWKTCASCSAPPDIPETLIPYEESGQNIPARIVYHLKMTTPSLEELYLEDSEHIRLDESQLLVIDFTLLPCLKAINAPAYCFFETENTVFSDRENFYTRLPKSLVKLEISFPLKKYWSTGVFSKSWTERKRFEEQGHENVSYADYHWLLQLAQLKSERFPDLQSVKLEELYDRKSPIYSMPDPNNTNVYVRTHQNISRSELEAILAPYEVCLILLQARGVALVRFKSRTVSNQAIQNLDNKPIMTPDNHTYTFRIRYTDDDGQFSSFDTSKSSQYWKQPQAIAEAFNTMNVDLKVLLRPLTSVSYKVMSDSLMRRLRSETYT